MWLTDDSAGVGVLDDRCFDMLVGRYLCVWRVTNVSVGGVGVGEMCVWWEPVCLRCVCVRARVEAYSEGPRVHPNEGYVGYCRIM